MPANKLYQGFTLIELIMVIVIASIIATVIASFIKQPIDAYFNSARRAALTDVADTVLRRVARDIHKALPNSIRQIDSQCIEFIPTKTGGRYRAETGYDVTSDRYTGDILDFTTADSSFDMLGLNSNLPEAQQLSPGDLIAIYNLGTGTGSDAYMADNTAVINNLEDGTLLNETKIVLSTPKRFPLASSSKRFHVIPSDEKIVSYVCSEGKLYRNSNYDYTNQCPAPPPGTPIMANHVNYCRFVYNNFELQRNALVQMTIGLTDADNNETIKLYHEAHVNNSP